MSSKASTNHPLSSDSAITKQNAEQLRQEIHELRMALETRTQENTLLNEVISTVGSTLRLDEVLRHLVDTVVRATSCQIALIYLYDKENERLVLASTNDQYQHLVGKISMALGEGIAGWVAMHQEAVFLTKEAMEDPRFFYFPELEEEKFQSIMTVPIVSKDRNLIGVITVQSVGPREFTEEHRTFMTNTAALVASAIENARLYENTQRKLRILTSLSVLSQTISSGLYLDDMLRSLATMTMQIMEVDQCVIMLLEQGRERDAPPRLTVRASAPGTNERTHLRSIDVDRQVLDRLHEMHERSSRSSRQRVTHQEIGEDTLEHVNPLQGGQYKALISVPLVAGTEQLGLINCYSGKARRFTAEDQTLLSTIANQAAIAIKNSYLVNQLTQKNIVKGFFEDLMQGHAESEDSLKQRAHFLGCDLNKPHAAVIIEMTSIKQQGIETTTRTPQKDQPSARPSQAGEENEGQDIQLQAIYRRISGIIRRRIQDTHPGSVFDEHENLITCIIPLRDLSGERLKSWLYELTRQVYREYEACLSIGIGNACQHVTDYRRGFAEANEALQMGQNLRAWREQETENQPLVTHFNDLGVYRYLYKIAYMDDLRDVYQEQVAHIDRYDKRKNTDLLATLEMYLECAGNLTKTSERLYVHRNTLIQRLERLQAICDIDIQDRSNWLTLQVAIKVYKLRLGEP